MRVVLQPKIFLCERYRDVGPRCAEVLAFANMRHSSEVFLALSLCLVDWLVGSSGDGVDDVDHPIGGWFVRSLWYLPRLELCWWG